MQVVFLILLLSTSFVFSSLPTLTSKEAKAKIEEVLTAHVKYKVFNEEIAERALKNFLRELDPIKSYLLKEEIAPWEYPSSELLGKVVKDYQEDSFEEFEGLFRLMVQAIPRQRVLWEKVVVAEAIKDVKSLKIKDLQWVSGEDDLQDRLLYIRSLQEQAVDRLSVEEKALYFKKTKKYKTVREDTFLTDKNYCISLIIKAICSSLDNHTAYFTPKEANNFLIQIQKRLFGIGALLRDDLNGLSIIRLIEGGPAALSNAIKVGDKIIAVNHEPIVGLDIEEGVELIRGPQGTPVHLTLLREEEDDQGNKGTMRRYEVDIIRGEIVLKETRYEAHATPFGDGIIAHLRLFSFYEDSHSSSASDLTNALKKMQDEHLLKGVILDLRSNSGGLLGQATATAGLFMRKGIIASVKDATGHIVHLRTPHSHPLWDGPLLILIDTASASCAEIVAQGLQDYGRALLIGDAHSYGKGSYQTFTLDKSTNVNPRGEYKVTRGLYYTVSGKSPQLEGAKADIVVSGPLSHSEVGEAYTEYPLKADEIPAHFEDHFEDVDPLERLRARRLFQEGRQKQETTYFPYLDCLRSNSQMRLKQDSNYQNFLKELEKEDHEFGFFENVGQKDFQLEESLHIMKDLLFLMKASTNSAASAA